MDWHEVSARLRDRLDAATPRVRLRLVLTMVAAVAIAATVIGATMSARSGSAAAPPGASPPAQSSATPATHHTVAARAVGDTTVTTSGSVVVSVAGAVLHPGVVTLPFGARVTDAIRAAGGANHDADPNALDLAAKLTDGVRVYVPKIGEHVSPLPAGTGGGDGTTSSGDGASAAPAGPVDLNTASESELEALPGIGPSLAQAIIATRTRLGGFTSIDELREVRGIGDRRFADLRPLVTI